MAELDILPAWAANYLQDNILAHAHVLNALPVEEGQNKGMYLLNTSRGAMMLSKSRMGEPRHWLLPLPGERFDFTCEVCSERLGFVNPEVPRVVHCAHCATQYTLVEEHAVLRLVRGDGRPAEKRAKEPADGAYRDFKGDVHPVIEVEGIGEEYARRLEEQGVATTARLCYEDADDLAARLGVPAKTVRSWQAMAQLMKISGVGPQYAEALVRAGLDVDALKRRSPERIADTVNTYLDGLETNVLGQKVTVKRVLRWKDDAKRMRRVKQPVPEK